MSQLFESWVVDLVGSGYFQWFWLLLLLLINFVLRLSDQERKAKTKTIKIEQRSLGGQIQRNTKGDED